jgi:hypothetical protein
MQVTAIAEKKDATNWRRGGAGAVDLSKCDAARGCENEETGSGRIGGRGRGEENGIGEWKDSEKSDNVEGE